MFLLGQYKKTRDGVFYAVKNTTMPAVLIELFFIDNETDTTLYLYHGVNDIAEAVVKAIK